jgi:hypothetical protein
MLRSIYRMLLSGLALCLTSAAFAQFMIPVQVLGSGASKMSGAGYGLQGTLGQAVIGVSLGNSYEAQQGFWFAAETFTTTGVDGPVGPTLPTRYSLAQNYPNPFNPTTEIRFALPHTSRVVVKVYNIQGALVETLADGDFTAGEHQLSWNASNRASGTYIVSMAAPGFSEVRKAVLLK